MILIIIIIVNLYSHKVYVVEIILLDNKLIIHKYKI